MDYKSIYNLLVKKFPHSPTSKQNTFFEKVSNFILSKDKNSLFVLKGYAGTGKTSVIASLVANAEQLNIKFVLLAPTGRAAKVIANYSEKQAFTIHKKIYFPKSDKKGGVQFTLQPNKHTNTIFIVDESSMISDASDTTSLVGSSLLDDLMEYVYEGKNCKLLLMGDVAQLPPVHLDVSPALDIDVLALKYQKEIDWIEFDEVMRQDEHSGILHNATLLREVLQQTFIKTHQFELQGFKDIIRLQDGMDIQNAIHQSYSDKGVDETVFIVRSNKRANQYNQQIRTKILSKESELSAGDLLMVVKNNYFWLDPQSEIGFIANGDIVEVLEIYKLIELYSFKFAKVKIRMIDYPNQKPFETILLLDTISSESPSLTYEQSNVLYQEVMKDYASEKTGYKKLQSVKKNPYFNALQVKFSYAVTCHKSQGGQWETVFVEQPYLPNGIDIDYIRWLYTAITRAKSKLYLIGFKEDYF